MWGYKLKISVIRALLAHFFFFLDRLIHVEERLDIINIKMLMWI